MKAPVRPSSLQRVGFLNRKEDVLQYPLPDEFSFLADFPYSILHLGKDDVVYQEGEGCGRIGFLYSGSVRVYKFSETGREMTLYRIGPRESCILSMSCALSNPVQLANAVVEEETIAFSVDTSTFRRIMRDSEAARNYVFTQFAERLTDVLLLIEEVVFKKMDSRLATLLLRDSTAEGTVTVTHQEIAIELGTVREVISRLLKEFERQELVTLGRGSITLSDKSGLKELARG